MNDWFVCLFVCLFVLLLFVCSFVPADYKRVLELDPSQIAARQAVMVCLHDYHLDILDTKRGEEGGGRGEGEGGGEGRGGRGEGEGRGERC